MLKPVPPSLPVLTEVLLLYFRSNRVNGTDTDADADQLFSPCVFREPDQPRFRLTPLICVLREPVIPVSLPLSPAYR